jgi:hypothetical protein
MTLNEMVTEILAETKRVDKTDAIRRYVRKAIIQVHSSGFYPRDIVEDVVDLADAELVNFKITLPARLRKFVTISPLDKNSQPIRISTNDNRYEVIESTDVIDSFFSPKKDVYYLTGAAVVIKSTVAPSKLYISWYEHPEVADNELESWLMADHDSIIMDTAKSMFYASVGRDKLARDIKSDLFTLDYPMLLRNYATAGEV